MAIPILRIDANLPDVVTWLREVGDELPPDDGFSYFNLIYRMVTEQVAERVAGGGGADVAFLSRLDVIFAHKYYHALTLEDERLARAWRPMRLRRGHRAVSPFRFAIAGMNAHINRDLAVALYETCEELGGNLMRDTPRHTDFRAVDEILSGLMDDAKDILQREFELALDRLLGTVDDLLEIWSIRQAREAAWTNGRLLQELDGSPTAREHHLHSIDRTAALIGRLLLV
jgi:hypothetical protein